MPPTVDLAAAIKDWMPTVTDAQLDASIADTQRKLADANTKLSLLQAVQAARQSAGTTVP
jgi:hypothetical protein